ncbi:minor tail protein [Gordonia phage Evaa]|nr:minor tail protein [Gordonia phage Evaa]
MAFRGYFALDGVEFANSSRVVDHLGQSSPTVDDGTLYGAFSLPEWGDSGLYETAPLTEKEDSGLYDVWAVDTACELDDGPSPGLKVIPESSALVRDKLYSPPNGSRRYGQGLIEVDGTCWGLSKLCGCSIKVGYDDTWPGLRQYLGDTPYRPELAPWYSTRAPESGEFGGVWVMDVQGLGPTSMARGINEMVGSGAAAGPHRDTSRTITFDAVLVACTNAGVEFGLNWLTCLLRDTNTRTDARLSFFGAHPSNTGAQALSLLRDVHGVVLTKAPTIAEVAGRGGGMKHSQATMYRVSWEMTALSPYVYRPPVEIDVEWDTIEVEPIEWVHAADCAAPETCEEMPVLFSTDCEPERLEKITSPPPSCGGCLPVCAIDRHVFRVPTLDFAARCRETAVQLTITNVGDEPLTLQTYWRVCGSSELCDNHQHAVQISGLPIGASVTLDGVNARYFAEMAGRRRRPVGIVGTPTGAPWVPTIIDRSTCWEFVAEAATDGMFEVSMSLIDREP